MNKDHNSYSLIWTEHGGDLCYSPILNIDEETKGVYQLSLTLLLQEEFDKTCLSGSSSSFSKRIFHMKTASLSHLDFDWVYFMTGCYLQCPQLFLVLFWRKNDPVQAIHLIWLFGTTRVTRKRNNSLPLYWHSIIYENVLYFVHYIFEQWVSLWRRGMCWFYFIASTCDQFSSKSLKKYSCENDCDW